MNKEVESRYREWLRQLDPADSLAQELLAIAGDEKEINERFYQEITFGTAGLRGICAAGTNRMNVYTVGRATQGIVNYMLQSGEDISAGVVIAYDCRYHSREFSEMAAQILAAGGIPSYLFPSLRPTPELSYAIRKLGALSGINMTASHNPKEYNGYKVYWKDGAQISGEVSDGMQREIQKLPMFGAVKSMPMEEAVQRGLITMLGEEMDRSYLDYVESLAQHEAEEMDLTVPVVYTPLNGAGSIPMQRVAAERGFVNFTIVPEHKDPDPDFTTVPFPNPEDSRAFALAEKLGREKGAEVLIATDPDSDRMAVEIADGQGGYRSLNGNQTGGLLIAYLAESRDVKASRSAKSRDAKAAATADSRKPETTATADKRTPAKFAMIKSVVTGDFGRAICEDHGIEVFEALTGFKNICGRIPELQAKGYTYFFGYEESIGCAPGEAVRDKDGIAAGMLIMEMAAWLRKKGMTIADYLEELYRRYGYFREDQVSLVLKGMEGQQKIGRIMDHFRNDTLELPAPLEVQTVVDFLHGYEDILPQNAMKFILNDGSWFAVRPSGTEPKIKFYYYSHDTETSAADEKLIRMKKAVSAAICM